jgi:hypothetical protein
MAKEPQNQAALRKLIDQRIDQFSADLKEDILRAIDISERAPEMALIQIRKLLEKMLRRVYERRLSISPGTQPLEGIAQRLVKERILPQRVASYVSIIRELGNTGAHSVPVPGQRATEVTPQDCFHALQALGPVFDWYFDEEVAETPLPEILKKKDELNSELKNRDEPNKDEQNNGKSRLLDDDGYLKGNNNQRRQSRKIVSWDGKDIASVLGAVAGVAVGFWAYNYISPVWGVVCGIVTWIALSVALTLALT